MAENPVDSSVVETELRELRTTRRHHQKIMKRTEQVAASANGVAPGPRFLRRLLRSRKAPLPVSDSPEASTETPRIAPVIEPVDGHCPKVLVVDDDPVILKTVGIKLSRAGFEVVTGHDGAEAITTARKEHPDVIVLDVFFPPDVSLAWDGIGVMKWLQRLENGDTPPIIIITGLSTDQIREKALAAGALAFFQKPIDNDGLIEAINRALEVRRASGKHAKPANASAV